MERISLALRIGRPDYDCRDSIDWERTDVGEGWLAYNHQPGVNQRTRIPELDAEWLSDVFEHIDDLMNT